MAVVVRRTTGVEVRRFVGCVGVLSRCLGVFLGVAGACGVLGRFPTVSASEAIVSKEQGGFGRVSNYTGRESKKLLNSASLNSEKSAFGKKNTTVESRQRASVVGASAVEESEGRVSGKASSNHTRASTVGGRYPSTERHASVSGASRVGVGKNVRERASIHGTSSVVDKNRAEKKSYGDKGTLPAVVQSAEAQGNDSVVNAEGKKRSEPSALIPDRGSYAEDPLSVSSVHPSINDTNGRAFKNTSPEGISVASVAVGEPSVRKTSPAGDNASVEISSDKDDKTAPAVDTSVEESTSANTSLQTSASLNATSNDVLFLLSDLYERFSDRCVRVRYTIGGKPQMASGFFVSSRGHVLAPVIGGEEFYVETCAHLKFAAKKCGEDPVSALCLLKAEIDQREVPYFSLSRGDDWPRIGQPIVGLSCKLGGSVSPQVGYVTAFQERYFATEFPFVFVRSSLRIDAGDCGGAVLDVRGNLLGMLFHALPDTGETFYMPSWGLERVFQDLLLFKTVRYGYAGLSVQSMYDPKTHAVCLQVRTVQPNSPAAHGGFKVNDVLLRVNDRDINSMELFKNFIFLSGPNDVLQFTVMRGKQTLNLTLRLSEKK